MSDFVREAIEEKLQRQYLAAAPKPRLLSTGPVKQLSPGDLADKL